jgi:hypothetical protein
MADIEAICDPDFRIQAGIWAISSRVTLVPGQTHWPALASPVPLRPKSAF